MSTYGDTGQIKLNDRVAQPTSTLIDIMREHDHWMVTLAPLRKRDGTIIATLQGDVTFTAQITVGHAGREIPYVIDWPVAGCTFCVCCSSLRLSAALEGSAIIPGGAYLPDIDFTAYALGQGGPRQTIWPPVRSVNYGTLEATPSPSAIVRLPVPAGARAYTLQVAAAGAVLPVSDLIARFYNASPVPVIQRADHWAVEEVNAVSVGGGIKCGLYQGRVVGNAQAPIRRVMMPPQTCYLELESVAATDLQRVRAVYDLDLG